jgi:hypothetical protein
MEGTTSNSAGTHDLRVSVDTHQGDGQFMARARRESGPTFVGIGKDPLAALADARRAATEDPERWDGMS